MHVFILLRTDYISVDFSECTADPPVMEPKGGSGNSLVCACCELLVLTSILICGCVRKVTIKNLVDTSKSKMAAAIEVDKLTL